MSVLVACPVILPPADVDGWKSWDHRPMLVVNNAPAPIDAEWSALCEQHGWWHFASGGRNRGVAASWNLAFRIARERGYRYVSLVSQTYNVTGGTSTLAWLVEQYADWRGLLNGSVALHGCTWSVQLWEQVGGFDERFWPAYYEDTDWLRRLRLLGLHTVENPMPKVEIPGPSRPALALRRGAIDESAYGQAADIYAAKWGGPPGRETVTDPQGAACSA